MNGVANLKEYDAKVQTLLEQCRISQKLLNYIENFNYPYVSEVSYYEQLLKIGQGTFGEVFKARCKRTGRLVALKKILMENEKEGFPITALREIKMLQKLRHQHITELVEVCTSKQRSGKEKFCFYLVFTFCEHDLAGLLSNANVKIKLVDIKTMMRHILRGLHKIHASQILHRDMKAANVLITADGVLKLADFGLARLMYKQPDHCYTNRVVTLWYRPPELLLGTRNYGPAIDIWGAGCIMAELWIRSPILQGNTEQAQLELISKLCGSINPQSWPGCDKLPYFNNLQGSLTQNLPRRIRERINPFLQRWANSFFVRSGEHLDDFEYLGSLTAQNNEQALTLIDWMLTLNPEKRPNASSALDHNFFFEAPIPVENIQELLQQLKGINLFEYTSGCGAHANRRRPMAPAAPVHHNQQQTQQIRAKVATAVAGGGGVSHNDGRRSGGGGQLQQRVQLQQHTLAGGGVVHQHQQSTVLGVGMPPPNASRKRPPQPIPVAEQPPVSRRPPPSGGPSTSWLHQQSHVQQSSNIHHFTPSPSQQLKAVQQKSAEQQQHRKSNAHHQPHQFGNRNNRLMPPPPQPLLVRPGAPSPGIAGASGTAVPPYHTSQMQQQIPRYQQRPSQQNPRPSPPPKFFNRDY